MGGLGSNLSIYQYQGINLYSTSRCYEVNT